MQYEYFLSLCMFVCFQLVVIYCKSLIEAHSISPYVHIHLYHTNKIHQTTESVKVRSGKRVIRGQRASHAPRSLRRLADNPQSHFSTFQGRERLPCGARLRLDAHIATGHFSFSAQRCCVHHIDTDFNVSKLIERGGPSASIASRSSWSLRSTYTPSRL